MTSIVQPVLINWRLLVHGAVASLGLQLCLMDDHFEPLHHLFASVDLYGAIPIESLHVVIVVVCITQVFTLNRQNCIIVFVHEVKLDCAILGTPSMPVVMMA